MVTAGDGCQVAFGWGELDPEFGAAPVLLAYTRDGQRATNAVAEMQAFLEQVPSDRSPATRFPAPGYVDRASDAGTVAAGCGDLGRVYSVGLRAWDGTL